jgi:acyl-coenzyme A synthetase/AMP-(fatty) acid ligase
VGHQQLTSYLREAHLLYDNNMVGSLYPFQLPPTFDAAITSYLLPLVSFGTIYPLDAKAQTMALAAFLQGEGQKKRVVVKTTPSQLRILKRVLPSSAVRGLRGSFVIGGEPLMFEDCSWLSTAEELILHNEYGPTEATVGCLVHTLDTGDHAEGPVPIGIPHGSAEVLLESIPGGKPDEYELILFGSCLANGYTDDTVGGFTQYRSKRAYRTGDIVRKDNEGNLYFLGRRDTQVKLGGHRVELGEIEAAFRSALPCHAVVAGSRGNTLWVAVAPQLTAVPERAVLSACAKLPTYARPSHVYGLDAIPLTPHGKVDIRQLEELLTEETVARYAVPRSPKDGTA